MDLGYLSPDSAESLKADISEQLSVPTKKYRPLVKKSRFHVCAVQLLYVVASCAISASHTGRLFPQPALSFRLLLFFVFPW